MSVIPKPSIQSGAMLFRALYKMSGLQSAMSALLDTVREFLPVVRINALYVPRDLTAFVNIIDTRNDPNLETIYRKPGRELPFLLPAQLGDELVIGDLEEFKTEQLRTYPGSQHIPFLQHSSLARIPLFSNEHSVFVINFWSDMHHAFNTDALECLRELTIPLAEDLRENFASIVDLSTSTVTREAISHFERLSLCPDLTTVRRLVEQVARTTTTVLIQGETGVGKESVAEAIHERSPRADRPLIKVNCGAIPEGLVDSELFGHERGAFTGANITRPGYFEQANGGTLFLDEIGDMPLSSQVRLLRVLESKSVMRVGSPRPIPLDVRIVAATHADLAARVQEETFRRDLWFRLSVFPVRVPPLRARRTDIPALVKHFIQVKSKELDLPASFHIPGGEMDRLFAYSWPGNIRELEHVIERSLILHSGNMKAPLRFDFGQLLPHETAIHMLADDWPTMAELEARYIHEVLHKTQGKMTGDNSATSILGIHYTTLRARMLQLGLPLPRQAAERSNADCGCKR